MTNSKPTLTIRALLDIDTPDSGARVYSIGDNEYANFTLSFQVYENPDTEYTVYFHPMASMACGGQLSRNCMRERERTGWIDWYATALKANAPSDSSAERLEAIAKTLRCLLKRLDAIHEVRHYARTSGENVGRILEVAKVDSIGIRIGSKDRQTTTCIGDAVKALQDAQHAWRLHWAPTEDELARAARQKERDRTEASA